MSARSAVLNCPALGENGKWKKENRKQDDDALHGGTSLMKCGIWQEGSLE